ncbi:MAG: hypothetical protein KDJ47_15755 [Hyphomicrobiaceae bacterium]|nr:hypothetical protein [Hyphomicrobiaceae bacterium]
MSNPADLSCDACKLAPYPVDAERDAESGLPKGWVVRRINGRAYTLCDCCGNIRHFKGGISTYLQENLGVPEYAQCEFEEGAGGGLHRNRLARRR